MEGGNFPSAEDLPNAANNGSDTSVLSMTPASERINHTAGNGDPTGSATKEAGSPDIKMNNIGP